MVGLSSCSPRLRFRCRYGLPRNQTQNRRRTTGDIGMKMITVIEKSSGISPARPRPQPFHFHLDRRKSLNPKALLKLSIFLSVYLRKAHVWRCPLKRSRGTSPMWCELLAVPAPRLPHELIVKRCYKAIISLLRGSISHSRLSQGRESA